MECTLCTRETRDHFQEDARKYVQRLNCRCVFLVPEFWINPDKEKDPVPGQEALYDPFFKLFRSC